MPSRVSSSFTIHHVVWSSRHEAFPTQQNEREEEFFGAPLVLHSKMGNQPLLLLVLQENCGVDFAQVSRAQKDGKEVLYYKKTSRRSKF